MLPPASATRLTSALGIGTVGVHGPDAAHVPGESGQLCIVLQGVQRQMHLPGAQGIPCAGVHQNPIATQRTHNTACGAIAEAAGSTMERLGASQFPGLPLGVLLIVALVHWRAVPNLPALLGLLASARLGVSARFDGIYTRVALRLLAEQSRHTAATRDRSQDPVERLDLQPKPCTLGIRAETALVTTLMPWHPECLARPFRVSAMKLGWCAPTPCPR